MKKQILIIGAGAVGLVYGKHFADAGHQVTFLIKEKYLETLSNGTVLYNINQDKALKQPIRFTNYDLITSFVEVEQKQWTQVYLCFSSVGLQAFDFDGFEKKLEGYPTIVMLQPSLDDYQLLTKTFPSEQIVEGMISLISYAAPLTTETVKISGVAYWLPPLAPSPFSGSTKRKQEVIQTFKEGKMPAKSSKSVQLDALFPSAFLMAFLTALEASHWKFNTLKNDRQLLRQLQQTINELFAALEVKLNTKRPFPFRLLNSPSVFKKLLKLAPKVMPMDIETYLEAHFTKVKGQTKLYLTNYLSSAKSAGTPHKNLEAFSKLT